MNKQLLFVGMMHVGKKIKIARITKGYSQEELAELIGKTRPLVSSIEQTGKGSVYTLKKICQVLDVDFDDLESETNNNITFHKSSSKIKQLEQEIEQLKKDNTLLGDLVQSQKDLINELKEKVSKKKP
ncbi:MAG: helix-turn-helix transcriptional regulator [Bacteroidia bacterium]|jgi:transcriptional regulator with XRE-family HTH domain|nr:helix-turn-helix transcriptional regulator [Bacteroidia bacterium]MBP7259789.1 helix-turn-helix transcriptional regulator [Bacteroidia bacterium]MBP9178885.1 helix-turn-helix transcriptional regulator [Bacteroidia bacterium]MBP9723186.1 helix-turn-helix transcriptional regulator [Bacteroidia bacterium]